MEEFEALSKQQLRDHLLSILHLLEEKSKNLELATDIGTSLLSENDSLKDQLQNLQDKVEQYELLHKEQNGRSRAESLTNLQHNNEKLLDSIRVLKATNTEIEGRCALLSSQVDEYETEHLYLKKDLERKNERLKELQSQLDDMNMNETLDELRSINEKNREVIKALKLKEANNETIIDNLRKDLKGFSNIVPTDKDEIIEQLTSQNKDLQSKLEKKNIGSFDFEDLADSENLQEIFEENETLKSQLGTITIERNNILELQNETLILLDEARKELSILRNEKTSNKRDSITLESEIKSAVGSPDNFTFVPNEESDARLAEAFQRISNLENSEQLPVVEPSDDHKLFEALQRIEQLERTTSMKVMEVDIPIIVEKKFKEGYMLKQGSFVKNWKKRYFFFESGHLYYAKSPKARFETLGGIPLKGAKLMLEENPTRKYSFTIETENRTYFLVPETEEEKEEWIEFINERISDLQ
eukprot:TRINITY_DN4976_c0_g1_i1.p1 TRINITY_DN4976_c0_g1~~TRINITY_DN4976_c0_g1_i1.p1  ORF type:complete len:472 (+),score=112.10 TRINITY_DN4976_c0_g1_i1:2-1417(+)